MVASTKSGTNDIHGSAFWFRNSDATQARNPFTQSPSAGLPSSKWNQFGGSVGGAVIKNKLFYFADYQGTRQWNGMTDNIVIPTSKVVSTCRAAGGMCDLSEYLTAGIKGGGQAYDPATGNANTGAGRTAFTGNLIPVSRLSPVAVKLLKLFPQPANGNVTAFNFFGNGSGPFHGNTFDTRADYQPPANFHILCRYTRAYYSLNGQPILGIGLGGQSIVVRGFVASPVFPHPPLAAVI